MIKKKTIGKDPSHISEPTSVHPSDSAVSPTNPESVLPTATIKQALWTYLRSSKPTEWLTALAAIAGIAGVFYSGILDASRKEISAQNERLKIEQFNLESEKKDSRKTIVEMQDTIKRLQPFEKEMSAIQSILNLKDEHNANDISFSSKISIINSNPLGYEIALNHISFNPFITKTSLQTNVLVSRALDYAKFIEKLKVVSIDGFSLALQDVDTINSFNNIEEIAIRHAYLPPTIINALVVKPQIKVIRLQSAAIKEIPVFKNSHMLAKLDLEGNQITDKDVDILVSNYPNLCCLWLRNEEITVSGLQSLLRIKRLATLGLSGQKLAHAELKGISVERGRSIIITVDWKEIPKDLADELSKKNILLQSSFIDFISHL